MKLTDLSDAQLLDSLNTVCAEGRVLLARLLAHLGEVEERRLHLEAAFPSMFEFCRVRLRMSEGEACRRLTAARAARQFPDLLVRIERGEISLSTIVLVAKYLTEDSYDEMIAAVAGKTKLEVQEILARRAPKPDVPERIVPLTSEPLVMLPAPPSETRAASPSLTGQVTPLAASRYALELTIGAELRAKIERAADLMRHVNPDGDLATVLDRAVDLLVEKLEKDRLGKTSRPSTRPPRSKAGRISRALRRAVFERDGCRCTFHDENGNRCPATTLLEIDHAHARALGGKEELDNLRVRCRAHNHLHAEKTFGRAHVDRRIEEHRRQKRYEHPDTFALASRGLVNMGFREPDVKRAIATLVERHDGAPTVPTATLICEALATLT
jgi:5-methylcytosine-specific restriction endonuclease McrA